MIGNNKPEMNPLHQHLSIHLETERLFLRPYRPDDGILYYHISQRNRTHLERYESGNVLMHLISEEEAIRALQRLIASGDAGEAYFLGVFKKETGEFVAQIYIGLTNRELPEYEIGYIADVDHQGKGYVTEAAMAALHFVFEHLGAHRVRLKCDDTNLKSSRVAERCGFVREGHVRENRKNPDGSISGTLHYGLLRSEFNNR
jgi:[ribosomal protein S5]-alanine N-acetyltransferase